MGRKEEQTNCLSCERLIEAGQTLCSCGKPTMFMSFAERTSYELAEWRAHLDRGSARSP